MATLILTAVGTAIGGPLGGALGALAGRAFDAAVLFKPKGREGPRLSELQVQTSSYGTQVPQIFGTMRVAGTVIWATDLRESRTKKSGGKGQPSVTTYSYSVSFAVALSARQVASVGRIWADGNLLRGSAGDFKSALGAFRVHDGGEDQPVDPLIASAQGIGVTPAHRGLAYAVFEDLQLVDFGNRIPSLTFEVIAEEGPVGIGTIAGVLSDGAVEGSDLATVGGYAASGEDVRTAIQPLVDIQGLVLREEGEALRLVGTGAAEGAVSREGLAARINGKAVVPVERRRAPADSVPVRLSLRHYDAARDYQAGIQKAVRPGPGRKEEAIDLPAVLEAGAARGLALARLGALAAERGGLECLCGWDALTLMPGAVVTVEGEAGTWQIVTSEWEAMGVRLTLRRVAQGAVSGGSVTPGAAVLQPDLPHGPTVLRLFELPSLSDAPASAPLVVAVAAGASDGWRKAGLFVVTPESGEALPLGETALPARMGVVVSPPGPGTAALADMADMIEVEMLADWMVPDQADDAALARGANLCLVGGELMQFGEAVQVEPRRFRLSRLWRGRRGTEGAMAGHIAGEAFLIVEAERLFVVPDAQVHMGADLSMIAIGIGDAEPSAAQCRVTGSALMPPAPVALQGIDDGAGGLMLHWTRRSRAGWRWSDGVDAPLAEEREAYLVRVLKGGAIVRTVEVTEPLWPYAAAMIAEDGGHPLTIDIRQIGSLALGQAARIDI